MKEIAQYLLSLDEPLRKRTLELMAGDKPAFAQRAVCKGDAPSTTPTPYGSWECDTTTGKYVWIPAIG